MSKIAWYCLGKGSCNSLRPRPSANTTARFTIPWHYTDK